MTLSPAIVRLLRASWPEDLNRLWLKWLELSPQEKAIVFQYKNQLLGSISAHRINQPEKAEWAIVAFQNLLMCEGFSPKQLWVAKEVSPHFFFAPAIICQLGQSTGFYVEDTESWIAIKQQCPSLKKQLPFSVSNGYLLSVNRLKKIAEATLGYTVVVDIGCKSPDAAFRLLLQNTLPNAK